MVMNIINKINLFCWFDKNDEKVTCCVHQHDADDNRSNTSNDGFKVASTKDIGRRRRDIGLNQTQERSDTVKKNSSSNGADAESSTTTATNLSADEQNHKTDFEGHSIDQFVKLFKPFEFVITTDHFPIWRRHLAWSKSGKELRNYITTRMSSNMVVLTLLLNAVLGFLYNSSDIPTYVRHQMYHSSFTSYGYYIGLVSIINVFVTVYAMICNFTLWGMVTAIDEDNVKPLLRSPIGQYTMQLATRLVILSLVLFLVWNTLMVFYIMNHVNAIVVTMISIAFYLHFVSVYTAFGRVIMHTGAMQKRPIFEENEIDDLMPDDLHDKLLEMSEATVRLTPPVQYTKQHFHSWWRAVVKQKSLTHKTKHNGRDGEEKTKEEKQTAAFIQGGSGHRHHENVNSSDQQEMKQKHLDPPFNFLKRSKSSLGDLEGEGNTIEENRKTSLKDKRNNKNNHDREDHHCYAASNDSKTRQRRPSNTGNRTDHRSDKHKQEYGVAKDPSQDDKKEVNDFISKKADDDPLEDDIETGFEYYRQDGEYDTRSDRGDDSNTDDDRCPLLSSATATDSSSSVHLHKQHKRDQCKSTSYGSLTSL